ncbi:MAG TPA: nodulation protein NfeD [Gaiellaceae bacterium]|nr:nodulation protein NfeD [Gaiellaceae bacterium]
MAKRTLLVALVALAAASLAMPHRGRADTGGATVRSAGSAGAAAKPRVLAITFGPDLDINPVTQGYLTGQLSRAASDHYDAAVILLDTPGGLSTSMKVIFNAELNAKLPVIVYVSPNGARAASAGVWVSEAADVLAMAPTTNIGSDLRRKVINDAVASLTALAQAHHRNTSWPAKAVRIASNLTASQALRMNVIDMITPSLPALLDRLNGYRTKDAQRPYTLHLAGAQIDTVKPGFVTRLLNTVIDPNLISILFLAGIIGLIFEVLHPGIVLPGALGAVCLVIALYGFSVLNPSWGGVALILLGVALLIIDLHAMTHGALTVGGLVALGFGMALLFQNEPAPYRVNTWLIVGIGSAVAAFWAFALGKGFAARRQPVKVGPQSIVGRKGEVRAPGLVFVNGELWQAHTEDESDLVPGEQVEVEAVQGLELTVKR